MKPESYWIKGIIFGVLGVAAIDRGIGLFPFNTNKERLPAPLVFDHIPGGPYIFSTLWIVGGLMMLASIFWGHSFTVFHPPGTVARLRLDDAALVLVIGLTAVWGISYYFSYFYGLSHPPPNTDYVSARNYLPYAIAGIGMWAWWFRDRTQQEIKSGMVFPRFGFTKKQ